MVTSVNVTVLLLPNLTGAHSMLVNFYPQSLVKFVASIASWLTITFTISLVHFVHNRVIQKIHPLQNPKSYIPVCYRPHSTTAKGSAAGAYFSCIQTGYCPKPPDSI
jgi:hypothetical protein